MLRQLHRMNSQVMRQCRYMYMSPNTSHVGKPCLQHIRHCSTQPEILVSPAGHLLVDENLRITISGLESTQPVTIHASLNEEGKQFESFCWLITDEHGKVDLSKTESVGGTYTGISSMGLFWSMVPSPGQMDGIRLMKKDVDTPYTAVLSVYTGHTSAEEFNKQCALCETVVERWYKSPGVEKVEVKHGRLRGTLYLPSGPGPYPAVIDLFGTVGGAVEYRSALLASRGIASFALPYFLYKDLPKTLYEIDLDYFMEAIDWLLAQKKVISNGLGVIGTSKGGDIAFMMGLKSPKVKCIVNINGSTFNGSYPMKYSGGDFPCVELELGKFENIDGKFAVNKSLDFKPADIFPMWETDVQVLNILAEDDKCGLNECIRLQKSLYPSEKTHNCEVVSYKGAGHLVEPPYTPLCSYSYHKSYGIHFWWGGHPAEHAVAQEDAWKRTLKHIYKTLATPAIAKL